MAFHAWIFGDLPLGTACGPSYMVESWHRELTRQGVRTRLFTPSGCLRRARSATSVTFRTLRNVGYGGDHHARFSSLAEVWRARRDRPDVILVTTPGRIGVLGITIAAIYAIPLVLVVSTDTTGAARHYNLLRVLASGGIKPMVLLGVAPRVRAALRRLPTAARTLSFAARVAARSASAIQAQAAELVLLSHKSMPQCGGLPGQRVTVIPAGIDRLPACPAPPALAWREGALRVLYVGRFAPEKSIPVLLEGVAEAVRRGLDVQLTLVGEGPLRDDLVAAAVRRGIAERVLVIGPFERSTLGGVYASADVFAFPSMIETQAFVLNEAAHEGLPLLVSDAEVNPVVREGRSAVVVPQTAAGYAGGLERLQDARLRARLGAGAQALAAEVLEPVQTAQLAAVLERVALEPARVPVRTR